MKRIIPILSLAILLSTALAAQEPPSKPTEAATIRGFRAKVFQIVHRDPKIIASTIRLLGSGAPGADMSMNDAMRTITVRDFPENLATIEEAIQRLDKPAAKEADIEFTVSVLIGSRAPLEGASVPEGLAAVVRELKSTLTYGHYGLMTTTLHRTRAGKGVEGSGVAEATLLATGASSKDSLVYSYGMKGVSASARSVGIDEFRFSMQVPMQTATGATWRQVGFETPVSLKLDERVVIGTATTGDKALIVVVSASVDAGP